MFALVALLPAAVAAEPLSLDVEVGRPARGAIVGDVDVPVEQVLAIVVDCDRTARWIPDVEDTRTVGPGRCAGTTNLPWPVPDRTWEIETWTDGGVDRWEVPFAYVEGSGNLDVLHGRYVLERIDGDRTRVTYEATVDLGIWVPQPLVAWATSRLLPGILDGIEDEAETRLLASKLDAG